MLAAGAVLCSAQDKPATPFEFYGIASVDFLANQLPPGASLGNPGRDLKDIDLHIQWAENSGPDIAVAELIEKFHIMNGIKFDQGRDEWAAWYAHCCATMATYGVDFGSPAANSTDFHVHELWARADTMTPEVIIGQLVLRVEAIFESYAHP
jgi:hypothetical protein